MKKLLSILASIGLVATSATAVVSCTASKGVLSDAQVTSDGTVTFKVNNLAMADTYTSIERVNAEYGVFDSNKNYIPGSSIASDNGTTTFKRDKRYNFVGTFKIANYDASKKYTFKFGTFGKDSKLAKILGTITVKNGTAQVEQNITISGTFKATFKQTPTEEQMASYFIIKGPDGQPAKNVKYTFAPDNNGSKAYKFDAGVSGTVTFDYLVPATTTAPQSVKISATDAAKSDALTGWTDKTSDVFSVDTITLSGDPVSVTEPDPTTGIKSTSYISRPLFIDGLTDNGAKALFKALYPKESVPSDVKGTLKKYAASEKLEYGAYKNVNITKENQTAADPTTGQPNAVPLTWDKIVPDGSTYTIVFYTADGSTGAPAKNAGHYSVYLTFAKNDYNPNSNPTPDQPTDKVEKVSYYKGSINGVTTTSDLDANNAALAPDLDTSLVLKDGDNEIKNVRYQLTKGTLNFEFNEEGSSEKEGSTVTVSLKDGNNSLGITLPNGDAASSKLSTYDLEYTPIEVTIPSDSTRPLKIPGYEKPFNVYVSTEKLVKSMTEKQAEILYSVIYQEKASNNAQKDLMDKLAKHELTLGGFYRGMQINKDNFWDAFAPRKNRMNASEQNGFAMNFLMAVPDGSTYQVPFYAGDGTDTEPTGKMNNKDYDMVAHPWYYINFKFDKKLNKSDVPNSDKDSYWGVPDSGLAAIKTNSISFSDVSIKAYIDENKKNS